MNFKRLFRKPTPVEVVSRELAESELSRLEAQSARDYAEATCAYYDARIKRLKAFLQQAGESK